MPAKDFSIAFVTLGCAKNEVDTDKMRAHLEGAGFTLADDAQSADLVIVNTCAFLMSAVDESLETIFGIVNEQLDRPKPAKVLVAGCMPARYGQDLADSLTEAQGFVSAADEEHIVERVCAVLGIDVPQGAPEGAAPLRSQVKPSAYVKISDGCNRFCSYCMIPHIRGRYHSFPREQILAEVAELVEAGTREIVFIGQDTGLWGRDFDEPSSVASLLAEAAESFKDTWFRLLYLQPAGIGDDLLECMASHDNICSYLDMPLQHADASVLERMNRRGNGEEYLQELARVRAAVPGIATRTTFMAGFPGETEEQFENLVDFADEACFDYAGVFPYSQEEGSAAALMDGQLDEDVKLDRAQRLLDACEAIGCCAAAKHVGQVVTVLVEGYEETEAGVEALCRAQFQAPEVDGQVHVPLSSADELSIGQFAQVRITDSFYFELEGELMANER